MKGTELSYCKRKDVKIINGDSIPAGFAIIAADFFAPSKVGNSLEELKNGQIRYMQKTCKTFNSGVAFIDFNHRLNPSVISEKLNINYTEKLQNNLDHLIFFYILAPTWTLNEE